MSTELPAPFKEYSPNEIVIYGLNAGWIQNHGNTKPPLPALSSKVDALSMPDGSSYQLKMKLRPVDEKGNYKAIDDNWSVAVAYGYAYEGHCYRFDQPKMLMFRAKDRGLVSAVGCGFGKTDELVVPYPKTPDPGKGPVPEETPGYPSQFYMWRVTKLQEIMEVSVEAGFAEKLILESNLPGNKAPNTYAGNMQLGHRSGRLTG